ncbi:MAG TPA: hypothetical protein VLJ11_17470 [Bryobacteraceae bacterium]|nr:hypothetical protein [Bryobacteraceae bacterium]
MENSKLSPATSLRLLRLGDSWAYQAAGTLTSPNSKPLELTGQITVSIVPDRLLGRSDSMTILFSQQFEMTQTDGSKQPMPAPEWMFSFVQDATSRDLSIAADNMTRDGTPRIAKVPQVFYPGSWSLQTAYSNRLEFDNRDRVDNTLAVFGQERVETEVGSFPSWVARISSESVATGRIEGIDWWTPELGAPAKFSTVSKMPDGSKMQFVATLKHSSVE